MNYLSFPTEAYFQRHNYSQLNFTSDFNVLKQNVANFDIYFSLSNRVTKYTKKYSLDDLVSKIGGFLGCFLGASLLSMLEIFLIFSRNLFKNIQSRKSGSNKK